MIYVLKRTGREEEKVCGRGGGEILIWRGKRATGWLRPRAGSNPWRAALIIGHGGVLPHHAAAGPAQNLHGGVARRCLFSWVLGSISRCADFRPHYGHLTEYKENFFPWSLALVPSSGWILDWNTGHQRRGGLLSFGGCWPCLQQNPAAANFFYLSVTAINFAKAAVVCARQIHMWDFFSRYEVNVLRTS